MEAHESQSGSSSGAGREAGPPVRRQVELARAPVRRAARCHRAAERDLCHRRVASVFPAQAPHRRHPRRTVHDPRTAASGQPWGV